MQEYLLSGDRNIDISKFIFKARGNILDNKCRKNDGILINYFRGGFEKMESNCARWFITLVFTSFLLDFLKYLCCCTARRAGPWRCASYVQCMNA